nr:MAG: hypothetical protein [Apis mellifra filamentous-like virus]
MITLTKVCVAIVFVLATLSLGDTTSYMLKVGDDNKVKMSRDAFDLVDLTVSITKKSSLRNVDLRPFFGQLQANETPYTSEETEELTVTFNQLPITPFFKTFRGDRIRFYVNNLEAAKSLPNVRGAFNVLHKRLSSSEERDILKPIYRQVDLTDLIKRMGLNVKISLSKYVSIPDREAVEFSIKVVDPSVFYPFKVLLQDDSTVEFIANSDALVEYFDQGGRERESIAEKFDTEDQAMQDELQDRIIMAMAKNDEMRQLLLDSLMYQLSMQLISPDKIPEEDLRKGVSTAEDVMKLYQTLIGRALVPAALIVPKNSNKLYS